jgi:hypothetical protein
MSHDRFFFDRFPLKCVQSTTTNEICFARQFVFQKKAIAKSRSHNILYERKSALIRAYFHINMNIQGVSKKGIPFEIKPLLEFESLINYYAEPTN